LHNKVTTYKVLYAIKVLYWLFGDGTENTHSKFLLLFIYNALFGQYMNFKLGNFVLGHTSLIVQNLVIIINQLI